MSTGLLKRARMGGGPPLWLMRQAGRYLPEYRDVRQSYPNFLEFCYSITDAAAVTLQPINRFGFDAAILFSDILVIPDVLGQSVQFVKGEGPRLAPWNGAPFERSIDTTVDHLSPVFETLRAIRKDLPPSTSLIGFCGAPWTVATYMVGGGGSKDHAETKAFALENPQRFEGLLQTLVDHSAAYLIHQVEAGADTLQIFDSWAGSVPEAFFDPWVIAPTRSLIRQVKEAHPQVEIIGFPKGAGAHLPRYVEETGVGGVGLDYTVSLDWAVKEIPKGIVVQGNLDPAVLVAGGDILIREVNRIHETLHERPYVFNLGHGILPQTPLAHVETLVETVRGLEP